jgi:hypothetical protein
MIAEPVKMTTALLGRSRYPVSRTQEIGVSITGTDATGWLKKYGMGKPNRRKLLPPAAGCRESSILKIDIISLIAH